MDGDNDLSDAMLEDINEITQGSSSANINILVQLDLPENQPARRFSIKQGEITNLEFLDEIDMASQDSLENFLNWAKSKGNAEKNVLILSDHGNGWDQASGPSPKNKLQSRALFQDTDNNKLQVFLHNHLVADVIRNANIQLDILGLDASIMGTIEALYEFSDLADILISSQEVGQASGWPYDKIFTELSSDTSISAETLSKIIVNQYESFFENMFYPTNQTPEHLQYHAIAAHKSTEIMSIVDQIDVLSQDLTTKLNSEENIEVLELLETSRKNAQEIDQVAQIFVYVDLQHFTHLQSPEMNFQSLIANTTIAEYHGLARPNMNGISIVFFRPSYNQDFSLCTGETISAMGCNTYDSNYKNWDETTATGNKGKFINNTQWDEFLHTYYNVLGFEN